MIGSSNVQSRDKYGKYASLFGFSRKNSFADTIETFFIGPVDQLHQQDKQKNLMQLRDAKDLFNRRYCYQDTVNTSN